MRGTFIASQRVIRLGIGSLLKGDITSLIQFPLWISSLIKQKSLLDLQLPWIPFNAIHWLEVNLKPNMSVFEYGSGGSTLFFSKRVKEVVSIEHHEQWFNDVQNHLTQEKINNCILQYVPPEKHSEPLTYKPLEYTSHRLEERHHTYHKYAKSINFFPDNHFDIVFIDGRARVSCIVESLGKIKKGGYLILDNSERKAYKHANSLLGPYEKAVFEGLTLNVGHRWGYTTVWNIK